LRTRNLALSFPCGLTLSRASDPPPSTTPSAGPRAPQGQELGSHQGRGMGARKRNRPGTKRCIQVCGRGGGGGSLWRWGPQLPPWPPVPPLWGDGQGDSRGCQPGRRGLTVSSPKSFISRMRRCQGAECGPCSGRCREDYQKDLSLFN
jgi:hypothetical protein